MHQVLAMHPGLHCKHHQNCQRHQANARIADGRPRQDSQLRTRPTLRISDSHHSWCTGKDSNLRTSLGGTDLQSVGFNHSPTCAEKSTLDLAKVRFTLGPCLRGRPCCGGQQEIENRCAQESLSHAHTLGTASLWSAVGKNSLRRRAAQTALPSATNPILELAKGFEPLTL